MRNKYIRRLILWSIFAYLSFLVHASYLYGGFNMWGGLAISALVTVALFVIVFAIQKVLDDEYGD